MAKKSASPVVTAYTGLWWPCPANPVKHKKRPVAVPIEHKNKFFIRCRCTTVVFFAKDWHVKIGMTEGQARAAGLDIPVDLLTLDGS